MKKFVIAGLSAAALCGGVAPIASAGFMSELDASDQVERVAGHRYHFDAISNCRTIGHNSFTCTVSGMKGDCYYRGRANVRKVSSYTYRVTTMRVSKDCL
jgi:hypothetical protein